VWNDLSENDVIYPSDGVEYVLKGSEIFPGCSSGTPSILVFFTSISSELVALTLPKMSMALQSCMHMKAEAYAWKMQIHTLIFELLGTQ